MPKIIVISGPTAVGKTVVINELLRQLPELQTGVTYMTRAPRSYQQEDKKIIHLSVEEFKKKIQRNEFLEWAPYIGDYHGTGNETLQQSPDKPLLLNLDVAGSLAIKEKFPDSLLIFILPENNNQIKTRLQRRPLDAAEIDRRYHAAQLALSQADKFSHKVVNYEGEMEQTVNNIKGLIKKYLGARPYLDKDQQNR